jgi:dTDP-4-dehydrorhamnose 3,5-epimerase
VLTGPTFAPGPLPGILVIQPKVFRDHRGFFMESYHRQVFVENGLKDAFVQDNVSRSGRGTLRGLHYQIEPHAMGKLVRANVGEIFDVGVDIRKGSPTYGQWAGFRLSAENQTSVYFPPGFAHGFLVLSETAEITYKCTGLYEPKADRGIRWNDPRVGVQWPAAVDLTLLSEKDKNAPLLEAADNNFAYI